jgi:hypothetical protein
MMAIIPGHHKKLEDRAHRPAAARLLRVFFVSAISPRK